ncbi:MAG: hypothetical protein FD145_591 [Candidatus Saganbacteria bacterium]|uniref:Uncharacterized protein n=1 Tax=Candidatus Saganbacteria bacterium TaxID=2575572 RepID=A0A833L1R7_UNCSA|nr:MAG: hypothetical protein FD145_591 [Candidatus Saganbacteria bacterium]
MSEPNKIESKLTPVYVPQKPKTTKEIAKDYQPKDVVDIGNGVTMKIPKEVQKKIDKTAEKIQENERQEIERRSDVTDMVAYDTAQISSKAAKALKATEDFINDRKLVARQTTESKPAVKKVNWKWQPFLLGSKKKTVPAPSAPPVKIKAPPAYSTFTLEAGTRERETTAFEKEEIPTTKDTSVDGKKLTTALSRPTNATIPGGLDTTKTDDITSRAGKLAAKKVPSPPAIALPPLDSKTIATPALKPAPKPTLAPKVIQRVVGKRDQYQVPGQVTGSLLGVEQLKKTWDEKILELARTNGEVKLDLEAYRNNVKTVSGLRTAIKEKERKLENFIELQNRREQEGKRPSDAIGRRIVLLKKEIAQLAQRYEVWVRSQRKLKDALDKALEDGN